MSFAGVLLWGVVILSGAAGAVLPDRVQARIDAAAREARDLARQEAALSRTFNPGGDLASVNSGLSRLRTEAALSAVVIGAISERPNLVSEVVASAVAAAPEFRESVISNATAAFPGFAGQIRAAAGVGNARPAPLPQASPRRAAVASSPSPVAPAFARPVPSAAPPPALPVAEMEADMDMAAADGGEEGIYDPLEGLNRAIFAVNDVFDRFLFVPLAQVYRFLMPDIAKDNIQNAFRNLAEPVVLANDLLQFEGGDALNTTGRFLVNTTFGVLGLFEVAEGWGMPHHPADFGQTLHVYGAGPGPYLVIPVIGPSNLRDGTGLIADMFLHPRTYLLDFYTNLGLTGGDALVTREALIETVDDFRANSIDFYSALRSAYYQDREIELRRGAPPDTGDLDRMFDQTQ